MKMDKLNQKIDNLSEESKIYLFNYIYNITINKMDNESLINIINTCNQVLIDRSFLIDNFNGNEVKDFVLYENGHKINCRLHPNSLMLGMNDNSEFILGTITNDMKAYLLKVHHYTNTIHSLQGNFNDMVISGNWINGNYNETVTSILINSENPLYDKLPSKKIDGFTLILKELYNKQRKEFKEIIQNAVNKDKSINPFKSKRLTSK